MRPLTGDARMSLSPEAEDFPTESSLAQENDNHIDDRKSDVGSPAEELVSRTSLTNGTDEKPEDFLPELNHELGIAEDGEGDKLDEDYDPEPKFKYERLLSDKNPDSAKILLRDSATALAVHSKFLALGTKNGEIHILDLQGNRTTLTVPIPKHAGPVNDISIDENGNYMASAGEDGKVFVQGLNATEDNFVIKHSKPVKSVVICPAFTVSSLHSAHKAVIFGSEQLVMCEKRFLGPKSTILDERCGRVNRVSWHGTMVAWGISSGVKVMCMKEKQIIGLIPRDQPEEKYDFPNKCDIFWMDSRTLIVSWSHVFQVCSIRDRRKLSNLSINPNGFSAKLPNYEIVINKLVHTDFAICGIAPYGNIPYSSEQYVLLGYSASSKEEDKKLQLKVLQPRWEDYSEDTCDILVLRGNMYSSYEDYHLHSLPEDGLYFIVSSKDIVIAKPLDIDDIIDWHLEREAYEEALKVVSRLSTRQSSRHNLRDIGRKYMESLRLKQNFEAAARACTKLLGKDKSLWEEQIAEFHRAGKLHLLAPYLPRSPDFQLSPAVYELVFSTFLQSDHEGFLRTVKEWPPSLYNVQVVINAVIDVLVRNPNQKILLEALGALYSFVKQFDKALAIYVKLKHQDVFDLIVKHNLYKAILDRQLAIALMEVDNEQAVRLFTENIDAIPILPLIKQLEQKSPFLLQYLDRLFQKDRTVAKSYHDVQAKLYAEYAPNKLLHFMQHSKHFDLRNAFEICQKKNMVPEMVYLLSRMGNLKEALELIMNKMNDIARAVEFCKDQNDNDLWMIMIGYSLDKPAFITTLLHNIGTHVDPTILIRRIKNGLQIPGLRDSLVRILQDYHLQITLREGCKKIMVNDCFQLLAKLLKLRQRGSFVDIDSVCHVCKDRVLPADETMSGMVVFQCRHAFHNQCLPLSVSGCPVCAPRRHFEMFT